MDKIDNKINKHYEKLNSIDYSHRAGGIKIKSSIDELVQRYISTEVGKDTELKDKDYGYNADTYNYHTGDKFHRIIIDSLGLDSFSSKRFGPSNDEEDINYIVDKLFLSKMQEKSSSIFIDLKNDK